VILTGLYDRAPISRFADPAVARAELADVPLPITPNPTYEFLQGREAPPVRTAPFGEFYDQLVAGAGSRDFCVEHDTPQALSVHAPPPPYVALGETGDGWVSQIFMAGRGNAVHLHYDCDQRNVLMYQVFGRKRYVIIDPSEYRKLATGAPPGVRRTSGLFLENFSGPDLEAFLRYANAWDCVLQPGEAVLIPAAAWHYVEYVDVALSVNFRLGRNRYARFLAEAAPSPSVELQVLAGCFRDEDAIGPAEALAFEALEAAAARDYPSPEAKVASLDLVCMELCERLGLAAAGAPYHVAELERRDRLSKDATAFNGSSALQTASYGGPPVQRGGRHGHIEQRDARPTAGWW
jgi:Cupin-like domain